MHFGTKFFWEFTQNMPLITGLILALQLWSDGRLAFAISVMLIGSFLGAVFIRLTENRIIGSGEGEFQEAHEPLSVTVANFGLMFILMLVLTMYLTATWSGIATDLFVGGLIGVLLSVGQSKAAGRGIGWRHSLAFTVAFPVSLTAIRLFSAALPLIISIFTINTIVTLIITYVDYGHLPAINQGVK